MSQTRENEIAHRITEMTKNLNEMVRQAAECNLKTTVNVLDHQTAGKEPFPYIDVSVWRRM